MRRVALFVFLYFSIVSTIHAQAPSPTPDDEPDCIVPARPTVSNPAQFQRPGVLQLEVGYNGNFDSRGSYSSETDFPLALRFAVSRRLLLELDNDGPYSFSNGGGANSGDGDMQTGIQAVLFPEKESRPGVAFAYYIKIPTGNPSRGLGSGRVDHSFIGLFSKTEKKTTVDFNAIYLLAGNTSDDQHNSSGQAALAVTQALTKRFGVQGEISGYSRNDQIPGAMLGLGVVTIRSRTVASRGRQRVCPVWPDTYLFPRLQRSASSLRNNFYGIANLYKLHH